MKRFLLAACLLHFLMGVAEAQSNIVTLSSNSVQGTILSPPGTGNVSIGGLPASNPLSLFGAYGTVNFNVTGSWTGTIVPEAESCDTTATWSTIQVFPSTSSTGQSSITGNGAYLGNIAGFCAVRLRGNTVGTANAVVSITVSSAGNGP